MMIYQLNKGITLRKEVTQNNNDVLELHDSFCQFNELIIDFKGHKKLFRRIFVRIISKSF
ncbi:protein of unknown function [Xenorhabdus poinarii G6]|uniref:Uncharacterized protein n=1 Tax=Xenorhabdus poinarii G6 TaxID=1354304 RepID=A0A068R2I8_9GAMM|nr:protein of unknown function [Xenorhabdus poinarii G6]